MLRTTSSVSPGTTSTTGTPGRRGAAIGASAAVVCLGLALASCGSAGEGYTAVGPAGGTPTAVRPTGNVRVVPLDPTPHPTREDARGGAAEGGTATGDAAGGGGKSAPGSGGSQTAPTTPGTGAGTVSGSEGPNSPPAASGSASPAPDQSGTASPAALSWGEPVRAAGERRWCDEVTLVFRNSGGTAVRSGTVSFGTHIIGALGIDWGTVGSEVALPAPVGAGARKERTWTVCVDEWRVPLGMHVETRDVDVRWE
ncbi:hypothetical protein ACIPSE_16590 [Streptomyces sp. NPDC090106]|uniref:hypothetical protein n=1 Tax=Streptomyces sp. NPDC090106 TaxID=3365946 RepID=UPI0037FCEA4E